MKVTQTIILAFLLACSHYETIFIGGGIAVITAAV